MPTIIQNNFHIITGGPGSGKSTLIDALRSHAYLCVDEVARDIIQEQTRIGGDALHTGNRIKFRELMLARSIETYEEARDATEPVFFDRGIPDLIGYSHLINVIVTDDILTAAHRYRYHTKIFLAPPWQEIYEHDAERKQSWDEAIATYQCIAAGYTEAGYELIELPKCAVDERVEFVLRNIGTQDR
jgi:predicted ATPase